jgi:hypothetical protein
MDEHPDRTDVILELLGKGQRLPHQPRDPLSQALVSKEVMSGHKPLRARI